jgi:putative addiction module component (TIGR02574 family)
MKEFVMPLSVDLSGIKAMSVPERILVVEEIWDSIAAEQDSIPLTAAQRDELDRRLDAFDASPDEGSTWQEVKSRIQRQK